MHEAIILLFLTVLVIVALARVRLPAVLAYLIVGVIVGPGVAGLVHPTELTEILGEIGIAFLLFYIGLEFSWPQLWAMRRTLFGLGSIQVLTGTITGALIARAIGLDWPGAVIAGGALALSSTAIVIKQLADQSELNAPHGRLAVSILLFQDLAAVPFLVAIPILGAGTPETLGTSLALATLKGAIVVVVIHVIGARLLPAIFVAISKHRNAELMTLTVLLVALASATLTHEVGLSFALGTFIAGMVLAETPVCRQVRHDIRPFRDVLLGLFFISVGFTLDLGIVVANLAWILLLTAGVVVGKGALIVVLARLTGSPWPVATQTGLILGQGGEFGLALLVLAVESTVIPPGIASIVVAAITLSMLIAPLVLRHSNVLAGMVGNLRGTSPVALPDSVAVTGDSEAPIILAGFGRTGRGLADVFDELNLPYLAVDDDADVVRSAWAEGYPILFGNAADPPVLGAAHVATARTLVVTFNHPLKIREVLHAALELRPELPIIVRAPDAQVLKELKDAGAVDGVPETLEASMMLAVQALTTVGLPYSDVARAVRAVRSTRLPLYDHMQTAHEERENRDANIAKLHVPRTSALSGTRIGDLPETFRRVVVLAVYRRDGSVVEPAQDYAIGAGDTLLIQGLSADLDALHGAI